MVIAMTAGLPKGKGQMNNRKYLYYIVLLAFVVVVFINYLITPRIPWLLLLIPAFGVSYLFPRWWAVVVVGVVFTISMLITELIAFGGYIPSGHILSLVLIAVTAGLIHAFFVHLRIKTLKLVKRLEKISLTDELTKTHNRRYLEMYMEKAFLLLKEMDIL